jgi:HlyD family secretion protein
MSLLLRCFFIAILASCSGCEQFAASPAKNAAEESANQLPRVELVRPVRKDLIRTTTQPATIHPYYQADIVAKVSGYFRDVNVDIGDEVMEGQPLCTLIIPEMNQQREQAVARQRRIAAELQRAEAAVEVSVAQVSAAEAGIEEACSNVERFEAQLVADRADLDRMQGLVQKQAATIAMLDEARAEHDVSEASKVAAQAAVRSARAKLQIAAAERRAAEAEIATAAARLAESETAIEEIDTMLAYTTLRAPFAGVITSRHIDPGDFVPGRPTAMAEQQPLFHVEQQSRLRVRVAVPERDAAAVDPGDPVVLNCDALPGEAITATVSRVARRLDPSTRTMTVEIDLDNQDGRLLPGMFGRATITTQVEAATLVLPASAIRTDSAGAAHVLIVDEAGAVQQVAVTTGADDGKEIQLIAGLSGDEQVIDSFVGSIQVGQQVEVVTP